MTRSVPWASVERSEKAPTSFQKIFGVCHFYHGWKGHWESFNSTPQFPDRETENRRGRKVSEMLQAISHLIFTLVIPNLVQFHPYFTDEKPRLGHHPVSEARAST